jgi:hypothetical protein
MKRTITLLFLASAALLTGCATDMSKYYEVQSKAVEADNNAVVGLAAAAAAGNQGAIMALAMRQGSAGKIAPPQDKAMAWASILIPSLTNIYGINRNTSVQLANIGAETDRYGMTMGTVGVMAGQGLNTAESLGLAGMDYASKPPMVVTTPAPQVIQVPIGSAPLE